MTEQYCEMSLLLSSGKEKREVIVRRWKIPLQLERNFGDVRFKFTRGGLLRFRSYVFREIGFVLEYDRGDYLIEIGIEERNLRRDGDIWNFLLLRGLSGLSYEGKNLFLNHLYGLWEKLEIPEEEIYRQIHELGFGEELKAFLYYSWHRLHVDERAFPSLGSPYYKEDERPKSDFNGGRTFLGATYCVIQGNKDPYEAEKHFREGKSKQEALRYFEEFKKSVIGG